jgi:hypothetical protein
MHHVRQENLPFVGSSHEFVGAEQGAASVSVFPVPWDAGFGTGSTPASVGDDSAAPHRPQKLTSSGASAAQREQRGIV